MKTVAIIRKNRCYFDGLEEVAKPLLYRELTQVERASIKNSIYDYMWSVIEKYVEFIEVTEDNIIQKVSEAMTIDFPARKPDEFYYFTEGSYSFPKKFIEIMHCQPLWRDYKKSQIENMNNIGCLYNLKHNIVENTCALIANGYDLTRHNYVTLTSITKKDIVKGIRKRYFWSAVLVKDNVMVKYYYQSPKFLLQTLFATEEVERLKFTHLNYNLVFYWMPGNEVNKICTRINGNTRIYGSTLILHELEDDLYADITCHEVKKIDALSYGLLSNRKVDDHAETVTDVDKAGNPIEKRKTPLWSKHVVVLNKLKEDRDKCINCGVQHDKLLVCKNCYRIRYCSRKCQAEFHKVHHQECIAR